jgi:tetratricopeptide (TPR) repeat protein
MASRKTPPVQATGVVLVGSTNIGNGATAPRGVWSVAIAFFYLLVALAIYANSFRVPFLLDDTSSIVENSTIRDLTNLGELLLAKPRGGLTTDGRPLLNLSFAINYAVSGIDVWSYHLFNLLLHVLNACLLRSLLLCIFGLPACSQAVRENAPWLAFGAALIWLVHPLQTGAVTYIVQRAESLMALFYLATLYSFLRMTASPRPFAWASATIVACWLGQATKEVMATAPLVVLAVDAALVSGSLSQAIRNRWRFYLLLFTAWFGAAALVVHSGSRSGTVSMTGKLNPLTYFVAQCGHLLTYLRLSVWPAGQIFDYGEEIQPWDGSQLPQVLAIVALIGLIFVLCWRSPRLGVIGLIPLLILAPTSSFIPVITQVAVEHRMYLPLASVASISGLLLLMLAMRVYPHQIWRQRMLFSIVVAALAAGLGSATYLRNRVYATELDVWEDTVRKRPTNVRACQNVVDSSIKTNRAVDIVATYEPALAKPWNRNAALHGRSRSWYIVQNYSAGIADLQEALRLDPADAAAYNDLAMIYADQEKWEMTLEAATQSIELNPQVGVAHLNRAMALAHLEHHEEAVLEYRKFNELQPYLSEGHRLFGTYWYSRDDFPEAIACFQQAVYYQANNGEALYWLSAAYLNQGNLVDALLAVDTLLKYEDEPRGWEKLAAIYEAGGDYASATRILTTAAQRFPDFVILQLRLGRLWGKRGDWQAALPALQRAVALGPHDAEVLANYSLALIATGNKLEAQKQVERALKLDPQQPLARQVQAQLQ